MFVSPLFARGGGKSRGTPQLVRLVGEGCVRLVGEGCSTPHVTLLGEGWGIPQLVRLVGEGWDTQQLVRKSGTPHNLLGWWERGGTLHNLLGGVGHPTC